MCGVYCPVILSEPVLFIWRSLLNGTVELLCCNAVAFETQPLNDAAPELGVNMLLCAKKLDRGCTKVQMWEFFKQRPDEMLWTQQHKWHAWASQREHLVLSKLKTMGGWELMWMYRYLVGSVIFPLVQMFPWQLTGKRRMLRYVYMTSDRRNLWNVNAKLQQ